MNEYKGVELSQLAATKNTYCRKNSKGGRLVPKSCIGAASKSFRIAPWQQGLENHHGIGVILRISTDQIKLGIYSRRS